MILLNNTHATIELMNTLFAHSGETHVDTVEAVAHYAQWYIAIPLYLLVMAAITYVVWLVTGKKKDTTLLIVSFVLLISGLTMFNISPFISVIAITTGLVATLFSAFVGLTSEAKK